MHSICFVIRQSVSAMVEPGTLDASSMSSVDHLTTTSTVDRRRLQATSPNSRRVSLQDRLDSLSMEGIEYYDIII